MTTSQQDENYGTTNAGSSPQNNLTVGIYNNNVWKGLNPNPLVGISETYNRNEAGHLNVETTITLNGFIVMSGCNDAVPSCFSPPYPSSAGGDATGAKFAFRAQNYIRSIFDNDNLQIKLGGTSGQIESRYDCQLDSLNFEEGTYFSYMRYTAVLKSYTGTLRHPNGTTYQRGAGAIPNTPQSNLALNSGTLTNFNETLSLEPVIGEYGMHRGITISDQEPISQVYYKGSYTLSISAKSWGNRRKVLDASSGSYATGKSPGWVIAKDFADAYVKDTRSTLNTAEIFRSAGGGTFNFAGPSAPDASKKLVQYNYTRSESIDTAGGTYTLTDNFIYAPTGMKALETWDVSYSSDSSSHSPTVTVAGTIKGLSENSPDENTRGYTELSGSTLTNNNTIATSGQIDSALATYSTLSKSGQYGFCRLFKRAQTATSQHLNTSPASISFSTNDVAGEVTYSLEFNANPYKFFTGAVYENITVEDTYPGDVYTTIPILGRSNGPILQYLYGRTEYKRTLNVEVVVDSAGTANAGTFAYGNRESLATKPSIRPGFKDKVTALINLYSPANEPGIVNWFADPPTESWNPTESRYTLSLGWTYELSE
jgi:hypothetical protein